MLGAEAFWPTGIPGNRLLYPCGVGPRKSDRPATAKPGSLDTERQVGDDRSANIVRPSHERLYADSLNVAAHPDPV